MNGLIKKSKRKSQNTYRQMKMKQNGPKSLGCSKSCSKKIVYSNIGVPSEEKQISNKQTNLIYKGARKRKTKKTQNQ